MKTSMYWYEKYLGLPWAAVPEPPASFSCGELVRHALRERHGVDMPEILANAGVLRECLHDIGRPARYGLAPLMPQDAPRECDVAYLTQASRQSHVGLAVETPDGLLVMHCTQGAGVTLSSPGELLGMGYRRLDWYRHEVLAECRQEGGLALSCAEGAGLQGWLCRPPQTSPTGSVRTGSANRPSSGSSLCPA